MKKLRRSNLSSDAYTFIRELFLNNKGYNPGDKISVEKLSRELGVSRTPLWGAINRLEAEGIVEVIPRMGVYLIDYDADRMLDIFLAREALEGMIARIAAEKITDKQIDELRAIIEQQKKHIHERQIDQYYKVALEFHESLARIAGSHTLDKMIASLFAQIRAMRVQRNYSPMHLPQSCDDHKKILDALTARDADAAEREARLHIRDLSDEIRQLSAIDQSDIRRAQRRRSR